MDVNSYAGNISDVIGLLNIKFHENMCLNKRNLEKKADYLLSDLRTDRLTGKLMYLIKFRCSLKFSELSFVD